jgi:hypothetical protein
MINIDSDQAILLVPMEEIGKALVTELRKRVPDIEAEGAGSRSITAKNRPIIYCFSEGYKEFASIDEDSLQELVVACGRGYSGDIEDENLKKAYEVFFELSSSPDLPPKPLNSHSQTAFTTLTKLVLISLWSQGLIILPRTFTSVKLPSEGFEEIAEKMPSDFLYKALSTNPSSSFVFKGIVDEKLRKIACNHWLRLIFNTDWYTEQNVREEDIRVLIENSRGSVSSPLARYYVTDLLIFLFEDHPPLMQVFEKVYGAIVEQKNQEKKERQDEAAKRRREWEKKRNRRYTPQESVASKQMKAVINHSQGVGDGDIFPLIGTSITSRSLRRMFFSKKLDVENDYPFSKLDAKVRKLVLVIDRTYKAFIASKRLDKPDNYELGMSILICYVSVYLPRFYRNRDGNLDSFPISFNELTCAYFIVRNEHLSDLINNEIEAPLTFFKFVELLGEKFDWEWDTTTYMHLKNAQRYFEYIQASNTVIPEADKFQSSIAEADIPKTRRRSTTVKNVLPREQFQVFLSLLESLDYFIDHINGMADGVNPGVVNRRLVSPSYSQLREQRAWRSIWPAHGGRISPEIDLACLNYTPVVRFGSRYYPLKQMIRFYSLTPYRVNGVDEERATPHVPRILWLMANTGIRQKHLIWLDKDGFDAAIPTKKTGLAPLIVSTDKAHSEWVSVVSRDVIDVCQRQREWLERNEIESLKEPMWYSAKDKSRFGKFIPLFRLDATHSSWGVHEEVGKVMWMLEKFVRHQVGDIDCPTLAYWKPRNSDKTPGRTSDHKINIEDYDPEKVDLSWDWRIYTDYSAHGLRAAFVSEHIRFLPPSLIGRHLTGQFSDDLVWYYTIMKAEDVGDHQQLLMNLLMRNEDQIKGGNAPELAEKITEMNRIIARDIEADPSEAISTHGLFSLSDVDDSKNGIAELKAKQYTKLACNSTHICPFGNTCPAEVVRKFGLDKPCTICPYAIRGVIHLPAINAAKFRAIEMMQEYGEKIKSFKGRRKTGVLSSDIENMEVQYDRMTRDAFVLEAIEQQLYHMRDSNSDQFMVQDSETIKNLYEKLELGVGERLIKRLIDIQCFPDLDSPMAQRKFSGLRYKLIVASDDIRELLKSHQEPESALLASQLHSMMSTNDLSVRDIYRIASANLSDGMDSNPELPKIGFDKLNLTPSRERGEP